MLAPALVTTLLLAAPVSYNLDAKSTVTYTVIHKLHHVEGTNGKLEGKARRLDDGTVQAMVRGQVKDFDSHNGNRDEHMLETVEAGKYPTVTVKATLKEADPAPKSYKAEATCEVTLHGVTQTAKMPVDVTYDDAGKAHVTGSFTVSLDGFKVQRPALLFVPVDDALKVDVDLWFAKGAG
jgi:polyisoprenoid-binding protein YceI